MTWRTRPSLLGSQLTKHLDDYEANVRPFANPTRPLDFSNLRVVAFVQDDAAQEILQVVQIEVAGDKSSAERGTPLIRADASGDRRRIGAGLAARALGALFRGGFRRFAR